MEKNSPEQRNIAVIGAAGYVGQWLCAHLTGKGHAVTGVCRPHAGFLLERLGVEVLYDAAALKGARKFRTVINLAYPTKGPGYSRRRQNHAIVELVSQLLEPGGCLIHASSLAVFGYSLDVPQTLGPISNRADNEYSSSKIAIERAFVSRFPDRTVHIVRLGNVWGPGSPNWTVGLLDKLRLDRPIGVAGIEGFSNATDVANICGFFAYLAERQWRPEVRYHHLAEFAAVPWTHFVDMLATAIGTTGCCATLSAPPTGRFAELKVAIAQIGFGKVVRTVMDSRRLGADARQVLSHTPAGVIRVLKRWRRQPVFPLDMEITKDEVEFLRVVSCTHRFEHAVETGWQPHVSLEQSLAAVSTWMNEVGYV